MIYPKSMAGVRDALEETVLRLEEELKQINVQANLAMSAKVTNSSETEILYEGGRPESFGGKD